MLQITEIYHSLQGEGSRAGIPCVFVRLAGCHLRCTWCDTEYGYTGGKEMAINEILTAVEEYDCELVEVTGGEPLMQEEAPGLMKSLLEKGYKVLLETSGACDISVVPEEVIRIVDMKCPGSEMTEKNDYRNLSLLTDQDELKFVIADKNDFEWSCNLIKDYGIEKRQNNFISPVHGKVNLEDLAAWVLDADVNLRLQVQLHKVIWGPDKTGV